MNNSKKMNFTFIFFSIHPLVLLIILGAKFGFKFNHNVTSDSVVFFSLILSFSVFILAILARKYRLRLAQYTRKNMEKRQRNINNEDLLNRAYSVCLLLMSGVFNFNFIACYNLQSSLMYLYLTLPVLIVYFVFFRFSFCDDLELLN